METAKQKYEHKAKHELRVLWKEHLASKIKVQVMVSSRKSIFYYNKRKFQIFVQFINLCYMNNFTLK